MTTKPDQARHRDQVMERVFLRHFQAGASEVPFTMDDIRTAIAEVASANPQYHEKNVADVKHQYTSGRSTLPASVDDLGPWMIEGRGKAKYAFVKLSAPLAVVVSDDLATIKIPDATPEIVTAYAGSDEQGILAKARYNRLLDIFLQLTCYHLQNHLRTSLKGRGQCEIDDLYVALDTHGQQFVVPIEAKCANGKLSKTQIVQNIAFARERYGRLMVRPVGLQEMHDGSLVLIEFTPAAHPDEVKIKGQRRYLLVPMSEIPPTDPPCVV